MTSRNIIKKKCKWNAVGRLNDVQWLFLHSNICSIDDKFLYLSGLIFFLDNFTTYFNATAKKHLIVSPLRLIFYLLSHVNIIFECLKKKKKNLLF